MTREQFSGGKLAIIRALGTMYNTLDFEPVLARLGDDTVWESQHVFAAMTGRDQISNYLRQKMATIKSSPESRWPVAAVAEVVGFKGRETCLAVYQSNNKSPDVVILVTSSGTDLKRVDICGVAPAPITAVVSDDYPGITTQEATRKLAIIG